MSGEEEFFYERREHFLSSPAPPDGGGYYQPQYEYEYQYPTRTTRTFPSNDHYDHGHYYTGDGYHYCAGDGPSSHHSSGMSLIPMQPPRNQVPAPNSFPGHSYSSKYVTPPASNTSSSGTDDSYQYQYYRHPHHHHWQQQDYQQQQHAMVPSFLPVYPSMRSNHPQTMEQGGAIPFWNHHRHSHSHNHNQSHNHNNNLCDGRILAPAMSMDCHHTNHANSTGSELVRPGGYITPAGTTVKHPHEMYHEQHNLNQNPPQRNHHHPQKTITTTPYSECDYYSSELPPLGVDTITCINSRS